MLNLIKFCKVVLIKAKPAFFAKSAPAVWQGRFGLHLFNSVEGARELCPTLEIQSAYAEGTKESKIDLGIGMILTENFKLSFVEAVAQLIGLLKLHAAVIGI